jgi:hypothetical protein
MRIRRHQQITVVSHGRGDLTPTEIREVVDDTRTELGR